MALKINKKQSIIASLCITVSAVVTGAVLSFLHDRDSAVSAVQSTYTVTSTSILVLDHSAKPYSTPT